MTDLIFNISPFLLFLIGLVLGYIIKLAIPEHIFHKNTGKNSEVFDTYYGELKGKGVKDLTAREYQHLSLMKKIEFEKKYPQKADSKISMPLSKVFTIHSVLPAAYSKPNTKATRLISILVLFSIVFFGAIFLINCKSGF